MCGITGWVEFDRNIEKDVDHLYKMTSSLSKRGPDATGYWANKHIGLGHKRLVVVDPHGGKQPMVRTRQHQKYVLIYNGELYNTEEIRQLLLEKGYRFEGHSDTEVLLNAYMEWQENCLTYLNGIFAFAIWDEAQGRVFIARDRLGVKPLFFYEKNGQLLFGSEIKAILSFKQVRAVVTTEGLAELFGLGPSRLPGSGVLKNIQELRPGHFLIFDRKGLSVKRYWQVKSYPHEADFTETVGYVRGLVEDAVRRQLVSDVPLCTFLSGGLDSSIITAIASQAYDRQHSRLHTFSIDYEENEKYFVANDFQPNADNYFIELMKNKFNISHHHVIVTQEQLLQELEEATIARDLPGMADIDSSLLMFCKEIRKDFVVGLSGECADEIFGGYPWFYRQDDLIRSGFPWLRSTVERNELLNDYWQEKLNLKDFVQEKFDATVQETPLVAGESAEQNRLRQLFYMNMIWFMTTLLDRKDRMSMGASIEVRVPFADHRLVEYCWNIPWEMKIAQGREKGLLRTAFAGLLPTEILERKKSPYPKTHHPKYAEIVKNRLSMVFNNRRSILHEFFPRKKLFNLIESGGQSIKTPWFGQLMTGPQLLAYLLQIHYWFESKGIQIEG